MLDVPELLVPQETIDRSYTTSETIFLEGMTGRPLNSYCLIRSLYNAQSTNIVRHVGEGRFIALSANFEQEQIKPRDLEQAAFVDSLFDESQMLNVCIGSAGTGKTTLAVMYACNRYLVEGRRILLSKPTVMVGNTKALGTLPGDVAQKLDPFLASYRIVLNKMTPNGGDFLDQMLKKKDIEFIPIEYVRGCSFDNCTLIMDETQGLNWHELNTIVSRLGDDAKMIILGDMNQIDTNLRREETGLYKMLQSKAFHSSPISSAVELTKQYRSPVCQLVADIDKELRENGTQKTSTRRGSRSS